MCRHLFLFKPKRRKKCPICSSKIGFYGMNNLGAKFGENRIIFGRMDGANPRRAKRRIERENEKKMAE
jgi:hypothetical protein